MSIWNRNKHPNENSFPPLDLSDDGGHHSRKDLLKGGLLLATVVATVAAIVYIRISLGDGNHPPGQDFCSANNPAPAHVSVLVDPTDPLTSSQLHVLRTVIMERAWALPVGGRLSLWAIQPDASNSVAVSLFSGCKPQNGAHANPIYENAAMLNKDYREQFAEPLNAALNALGKLPKANTSPILEAIYSVVNSPDFSGATPDRSLIVFSDMLEYSDELSHFKLGFRFEDLFRKHSVYITDIEVLSGADVIVYQLTNRYRRFQTKEHGRFWRVYFQTAGAATFKVKQL